MRPQLLAGLAAFAIVGVLASLQPATVAGQAPRGSVLRNFTRKIEFQASRENLRLIERLTRVSATEITYRVTIDDPSTWTRPWTVEVPWQRLPDRLNQVYESTCHEGNYGLLGMLANTRAAERLFRQGKGPDPATQDNATGGGGN